MGEGSGLNSLMAVTEEPYITDLDLDSFLIDVTDNALDLVTTEVGGVTAATTEAGVMATEAGNTVDQFVTDWLQKNVTLAGGSGEDGPSTILNDLADVLLGNETEDSRIGFTFPATELPETVISGQLTTAPGLTDYTAEIFDLLTGRGNDGDRLANGLELTKDFGHTDNVNELFDERKLSVTGLAADFTQNAQHVFLTAEPPSGGLRDYTDNVFKMLFHADELDGLQELDGDTNCTVWNATERAADRVGGGAYGLDQNFLMGELVLVMVLCIPASLAVIIYILRQAVFFFTVAHFPIFFLTEISCGIHNFGQFCLKTARYRVVPAKPTSRIPEVPRVLNKNLQNNMWYRITA
jgi:hypothetical protein